MSNILDSKDFGLKIYNKFPPKYREDDVEQLYALKNYLESLADGGFKYTIDDINGLMHLIDPSKIDAKLLPTLFKQYGLNVFNGIPEDYLRRLLPNLGEAWSNKGSLDVLEFITSSLSGVKTNTEIKYDEDGNPLIDVRLEMDYNLGDYFPDARQFNRILDNFLPFYADKTLIYSYVFKDLIGAVANEEEFTEIVHKAENDNIGILLHGVPETRNALFNHSIFGLGLFNSLDMKIPTEVHFDSIKLSAQKETGLLNLIDAKSPVLVKNLFSEESNNKVEEESTNVVSYTSSTNATFVTGVFGKAVLDDNSFDKHVSVIT